MQVVIQLVVIFVCYFRPCLKACRLEIQVARSFYQASNELLVCPTLSQFSVHSGHKQTGWLHASSFSRALTFYNESVEPDRRLNTASYTHLPELWSEVTSTGFMIIRQQGDLLRLWEIFSLGWQVSNTYRRYTQNSCNLFHCHEITHNLAHNALVHTNGRFMKLRNFDHAIKTLYSFWINIGD